MIDKIVLMRGVIYKPNPIYIDSNVSQVIDIYRSSLSNKRRTSIAEGVAAANWTAGSGTRSDRPIESQRTTGHARGVYRGASTDLYVEHETRCATCMDSFPTLCLISHPDGTDSTELITIYSKIAWIRIGVININSNADTNSNIAFTFVSARCRHLIGPAIYILPGVHTPYLHVRHSLCSRVLGRTIHNGQF